MKKFKQLLLLIVALGSLQLQTIIGEEKERFNFYKNPLRALYEMFGGIESYLCIPNLIDVNELKKIFENNDIYTADIFFRPKPWSPQEWNVAYETFKEAQYKGVYSEYVFYTSDELLKLLAKAKKIVKSFLPTDDFSPIFIERNDKAKFPEYVYMKKRYIKKYGINRLFTYTKLQQVITEENLTHIRLPLKFLLIEDKETGEYVSTEEALQIIDSLFKICVFKNNSCKILPISDRYSLDIFAKKEINKGTGFSKATMEQLFTLCRETPFDIGYRNIFYDTEGDAIIIDTELKGEVPEDCYKLERYPVDESLSN